MESLLADYASSDEEEENPNQTSISSKPFSSSSLSSLIPQPKSALPQFKQPSSTPIIHYSKEDENPPKSSSKFSPSFFSSLPQPKSQASKQSSNIALNPNPKKVVQFKPPINPNYTDFEDEEDEDEDEGEKERKQRKQSESLSQSSSVKSFLSSIPAPKNSSTLGALPSAAGSGRRSIIETEAPDPNLGGFGAVKDQNEGNCGSDGGISASYEQASHQNGGIYVDYGGYSSYESGTSQDTGQNVASGDYGSCYENYESYSSYGNYGDYGQYGNNCGDGLAAAVPEVTGAIESAFRVQGKRGRKDIPTEVIEVKQDELTKNRPREDQVKLTGIAFGPSYQPTSTKGKPLKLHKRKHQIGTLYYDMKQKEMELAERRAKGFLTKAQTHAKYGW